MQAVPSHLSDLARGFAPEPDGAAQADKAGRGFVGQCRVSAKHRLPAARLTGGHPKRRDSVMDVATTTGFARLAPIFERQICLISC